MLYYRQVLIKPGGKIPVLFTVVVSVEIGGHSITMLISLLVTSVICRGVFRTFELRVLTVIDCSNIAGAKAPVAPVLNTPLISIYKNLSILGLEIWENFLQCVP